MNLHFRFYCSLAIWARFSELC